MAKLIKEILDDYCVLDLETTGFSCDYNEIIEIGILKVRNNKIVSKYERLIKPYYSIPYNITNITGITNKMVSKCPYIEDIKDEIIDFIDNDVILGHNTNFDVRFLNTKINANIEYYLDTVSFSRKVYPELYSHSLSIMSNYLGLSNNEHRSIADCITTKELYDKIKEYLIKNNMTIKDLYKRK